MKENKYREFQGKIIQLKGEAHNHFTGSVFEYIEKHLTVLSDYLFNLHMAYENGRTEERRKHYGRMGEQTDNLEVLDALAKVKKHKEELRNARRRQSP